MNVRELKEQLADLPDDLPVLLAGDPEGNDFRTLTEISEAKIPLNDDKHGYTESVLHPDDEDAYEDHELEDRLVLWP